MVAHIIVSRAIHSIPLRCWGCGRCHRYGQKHDVVVINFVNTRNHADQRVLELLTDKGVGTLIRG